MKPQSVSLFYNEGSSDKVYNASLEPQGKGWVVKFSYGRRGTALNTGEKTLRPIPFDEALKVYEALVRSKTQKGYTPEKSGVPFISTVDEQRSVGWVPQLLNEIEEEEVESYLKNPEFCAQEKYDGRNRLLLMEKGTGATGANRKGLAVAVSDELKTEMSIMSKGDVIAGEDMGDTVMCFDLISCGPLGYKKRLELLNVLLADPALKCMKSVYTAFTEKEKRALYKKLVKNNAEGIVFKHVDAHYTPGRPASGGAQIKFKFCATCSVIAGKPNKGKRSVPMIVYTETGEQNIGNVTVYPNQEIPKEGQILEVKYLYAYKGGSLYQPVLLGVRDDLDHKACKIEQLKFKKEEETVS